MEAPKKGYHFDSDKHIHYLDGKCLMGTTTVLGVIAKPQLIPWAVNMAIDYIKANSKLVKGFYAVNSKTLAGAKVAHSKNKEKAAEKGTDIHAMIEELVKNAITNAGGYLDGSAIGPHKQVNDFIEWAVERNVKFLESEISVYSRTMFVGGICDLMFEIDGKVYVGDIKTSKYIYTTYWFQTAAYQVCMQEMGMYPNIAGHIIIKTSEKTGFEVQENFDFKGNSTAFKACLYLHRQLESLKAK